MATRTWVGDVSTAFATAGNWSDNTAPVAGDSIIFNNTSDGNSGNVCLMIAATYPTNGVFHDITIASNYIGKITTSGTVNINLDGALSIAKADCLKFAGATTVTFSGLPSIDTFDGAGTDYTKALVSFTANTSVWNTGRDITTFNFGSQTFSMIDGVYPKITYTGTLRAKKIYSDASRTEFNNYGCVDMLDFSGGIVNSTNYDIYDYTKEFLFEGTLTAIGETFRFGHTTARFKTLKTSSYGAINFPVSGSSIFAATNSKNFYAQYHKLVIETNDVIDNYWLIPAGLTIECNELVIKDGGRIYGSVGTDIKAATIKSVKRPTIRGDWNMRQIADGVYETIGGISNTPVYHGGTGRQTLTKNSLLYGNGMDSVNMLGIGAAGKYLKVNSGANGYEWADASGGGGSGTVTPSSADTFTNKTIDADGTGNSITNIDSANFTSAFQSTYAYNSLHPIFFERGAINTSAVDFRAPTTTSSSANPNAFPMPYAGKVIAASFIFSGGTISNSNVNNTIRIRKNGGVDGGNIYDTDFVPHTDQTYWRNTNGSNYTLVFNLGTTFGFAAGDIIQVKRQSGSTNLYNAQAILWVQFN